MAGIDLDGWQQDVLDGGLRLRPDGKLAARRVGLVVPRQNGKTAIVIAAVLQAAVLSEARLILVTSHLVPTNLEAFRTLVEAIKNSPDLAPQLATVHRRNGREAVELVDGTRILFRARGRGSGRGPSPDLIVYDVGPRLPTGSACGSRSGPHDPLLLHRQRDRGPTGMARWTTHSRRPDRHVTRNRIVPAEACGTAATNAESPACTVPT